uniref:Mediator of RNA polymerase II transcription subunit 7 n=2 Tax=Ascaris TaxID=6251 RepID=A0A0M3I9G9_ASCLU
MATQPQAVISPFPQPPEYAKQYTDENISKKVVLPPPPVPTEFTVFGEEYNFEEEMIRSLQTQKMQQLFSSTGDWRSELKKLNRSTVAAFLDLLDILIRCPSHPERMEKLNNLRLLFINMHHLINEYRPLQARDTLQLMMKQQIASTEEVIERFRLHLAAGRQALSQCIDEITVFEEIAEDEDMDQTDDVKRSRLILANSESEIEGEKGARNSMDERRRALQRDVALCRFFDLAS